MKIETNEKETGRQDWFLNPTEKVARRVANCIEDGGVALFPADTVYGFFGNALDSKSYERVYEIKKRERRKPFVVYTDIARVEEIAYLNPMARKLIERFWPHEALALVLPKRDIISDIFTDGKTTIAVMSAGGEFVSEVIRACNSVIFGTTCNISGMKEITRIDDARNFADQVDFAVGGDQLLKHSVPSTIVDCTGDEPKIIRESAIPAAVVIEAYRS